MAKNDLIRRALEAIQADKGRLVPEDIIQAARPRDHELHNEFEWDNRRAGHQHRLNQARNLIRLVRVELVTDDEVGQVRQWHAARWAGAEDAPPGYVSNEEVIQNPSYRKALEQQMRRELAAFRRRFIHLTTFWDILTEVLGDNPQLEEGTG